MSNNDAVPTRTYEHASKEITLGEMWSPTGHFMKPRIHDGQRSVASIQTPSGMERDSSTPMIRKRSSQTCSGLRAEARRTRTLPGRRRLATGPTW